MLWLFAKLSKIWNVGGLRYSLLYEQISKLQAPVLSLFIFFLRFERCQSR